MATDTPATESNASLSVHEAASLFGGEPEQKPVAQATEPPETEDTQADPETETVEDAPTESPKFTVKVDGKDVELTEAEIADHYKNGLRQADYTRKTMEAAEQRKAVDADAVKVREERQRYLQGLSENANLLSALVREQHKTVDWDRLVVEDPAEYQRQRHLLDRRQAELAKINQHGQHVAGLEKSEREQGFYVNLAKEHQATLDKLPEWKDQTKKAADQELIGEYLGELGFDPLMIYGRLLPNGKIDPEAPGITNHRILLMAREGALYRRMMSKAKAAAKQVQNLPQKVERPGSGETNPSDGRSVAMKRLAKSGSVLDAAKALEGYFK